MHAAALNLEKKEWRQSRNERLATEADQYIITQLLVVVTTYNM